MEKSANGCMPKRWTLEDGVYAVLDVNGNVIFKVRSKAFSVKYFILDAAGNPLVTLKQKSGESTNDEDFLFTVKTTSIMQFHAKLAVFLANNTSKEKVSDFMIKGSWSDKSCAIYAGDSSTIIAQMHNKIIDQKLVIGKENLTVTICPNIDYAFIAALMVIFGEITATNDALLIAAVIGTGAAVAS
ncbi:hypothetical protein P3S67_005483 [Capsicum chacoense]